MELVEEDIIMEDVVDVPWLLEGEVPLVELIGLEVDRLEVVWPAPGDEVDWPAVPEDIDEVALVALRMVDVVLEGETWIAATFELVTATGLPAAGL